MGILSRILARGARQHARRGSDPVRAGEFLAFPAGGGQALVCASATGAARLLPAAVVDLLRSCVSFAPLAEHVARWRESDEGATAGSIATLWEALDWLRAEGVLLSASALLQTGLRGAARRDPQRITALGVVTCERGASLAEAIAGHLAATRRWGRRLDLAVLDDTAAPAERAETREWLSTLRVPEGVSIGYAGREEKERFAAALSREAAVPPGLIAFALFDPEGCGRTVGANRNALLLHAVGELLLGADDDVRPEPREVPGAGSGLALVSRGDPTEFTFFADRRAAVAATRPVGADALAAHERLLGADLATCVERVTTEQGAGAVALDEASPRLLTQLLAGRGQVRLTLSGLIGDSGLGGADGLLTLAGRSRERLLASERAYRSACVSREVLRAVSRPTIGEVALCMTPAIGLDNRALLPPFFPVRRNQDGVFGLTARLCFDDTLTGLLPHALLHAPPEARRFPADAIWAGAAAYHVADVVMDTLASLVPLEGPPGSPRLRAMGRRLQEIAALSPEDFLEHVDVGRRHRLSRRALALEELLQEHDAEPEYWARDVRRQLEVVRRAVLREGLDVPVDLSDGRARDEARALTRRLLLRYGELLEAWPALVDGARRLRARGVRVAGPVAGRCA